MKSKIRSIYVLRPLLFFCFFSAQILAQGQLRREGIAYATDADWMSILNLAKKENKYIFVDCYATWCNPCKRMDKDVFENDSVVDYINEKFVSVKIQFDTTSKDDKHVKQWHEIAKQFRVEYGINKFPTFLFFSPGGELVHEGAGYYNISDFFMLTSNAMNSQRQFHTLYKKYSSGIKDYSNMPYFINHASELGNQELVNVLIEDYKDNFLYKLPIDSLFTTERIIFLAQYLKTSKEKGFRIFNQYSDRTVEAFRYDSTLFKRFTNLPIRVIKYFAIKEDILEKLWNNKIPISESPNWDSFAFEISRKYIGHLNQNDIDSLIDDGKLRWYKWKQDWLMVATIHANCLKKFGTRMDDIAVNTHAWNIFLYSNKKTELETALLYLSKFVIDKEFINPLQVSTETDTYANLLYKLGRKDEALFWENRAYELDCERDRFLQVLTKMRSNEITWIYPIDRIILNE